MRVDDAPTPLVGDGATLPPPFSAMVVHHQAPRRAAWSHSLAGFGAHPLHEAGSSGEALLCARAWGPCDLAVIHLGLPDGAAVTLLDELRGLGWARLVVVAGSSGPDEAVRAFEHGACGYLVDGGPGPARAEDPPVPGTGVTVRIPGRDGVRRELTAREVQVLQLIAHGQSNRDAGVRLGLSGLTVKSHLSRISRKLGTGDRAELVALAMRAGIIT